MSYSTGQFYLLPTATGSYYTTQATGSYYTTYPGEVYAGYGATDTGTSNFNAAEVWGQAEAGGACYTPGNPAYLECQIEQEYYREQGELPPGPSACGPCNYASGKAAKAVQRGLNELGYGPLDVDSKWGPASKSAWEAFTSDQGIPSGPGLMNKVGVYKMEELLQSGAAPGPNAPLYKKMGGGKMLLLAAVLGGVGYLAYKRSKKGRRSSSRAMVTRL